MNVHANESENHKHGCGCHSAVPSVHQSLEEIDFERGIWSAAVDGDIEKVRKFLNKGVQPSIRDSSGYTALHYAARNGHIEICEELLQKGANPNAQTTGGATPLHRAALQGHSNIVSLLLNYKADPTLQDSDGKNSLHKAAAGGHIEIAKVLVKMNESLLNQEDNKGLTPAKYASFDNPVLLEILQAATVS